MKYILLISVYIYLASCEQISFVKDYETHFTFAQDTLPTTCAYLTQNHHGNSILSYVKKVNDTTSSLFFEISTDEGKTFHSPKRVVPSQRVMAHGENLPKIVFKPTGEIIAVWGESNPSPKKKYGGLIFYSQSFDGGTYWSQATPLVTDTAGFDQRYFDVALLSNGEAAIIWLDNRTTSNKEGSTLYFAVTEGQKGFINEKPLVENTCQCCRTDLFVDGNGGVHIAFRKIINELYRDMVYIFSSDRGNSFTNLQLINPDNWEVSVCPHTGPTIAHNSNGVQFAWFTLGGGEGIFYNHTKGTERIFTERQTVSQSPNAKHPQITTDNNGSIFIVWDEVFINNFGNMKRIGLQFRDADGALISHSYISAENEKAEYPVIQSIGEKRVLIAYTIKVKNINKIVHQVIQL